MIAVLHYRMLEHTTWQIPNNPGNEKTEKFDVFNLTQTRNQTVRSGLSRTNPVQNRSSKLTRPGTETETEPVQERVEIYIAHLLDEAVAAPADRGGGVSFPCAVIGDVGRPDSPSAPTAALPAPVGARGNRPGELASVASLGLEEEPLETARITSFAFFVSASDREFSFQSCVRVLFSGVTRN